MSKEWVEQIESECNFRYVYPEFLRHIVPIGITPEHIKGRVLVMGQAHAFPEKTLICTPQSDFEKLRREIDGIFCIDTAYPSSPETHLDIPCVNTVFFDKIPVPEPNTAYWELKSSYAYLPKVEFDFFDTVLFFRVVDVGQQIQEMGLVNLIAPHLKKGGHFIFSGGRFPENINENYFEPLNVLNLVKLSNYSDGFPFTNNMGVILQKR